MFFITKEKEGRCLRAPPPLIPVADTAPVLKNFSYCSNVTFHIRKCHVSRFVTVHPIT